MMQNKIALVTGGNRGLGKDMVINLAKKGLDVIFTYNTNKQEAEAVVQTIQNTGQKAFSLQLNVRTFQIMTGFLKTFPLH
jgi:NAD(P)-dependent dehydrogenase (short-subunit alcohol dehydrogenase family)